MAEGYFPGLVKTYFPLALMLVMAVGFGIVMTILSSLAGKKRPTEIKESAYECGSIPVGTARIRFDVKFYVVAILFILFDLEVVFLYPWAITLKEHLRGGGVAEAVLFLGILVVGYVYAWRKGALEWE